MSNLNNKFDKKQSLPLGTLEAMRKVCRQEIKVGAGLQMSQNASGIYLSAVAEQGVPFKRVQLLHDNFVTEEIDGKSVNARDLDDEEIYYQVSPVHFAGFGLKSTNLLATKIEGIWYGVGEGLMVSNGVLTSNIDNQAALCDLVAAPGNNQLRSEDPIVVFVSNLRWNGLKTGHPVTLTWDGSKFVITSIQNEFATGTYGNGISINGASYSIFTTSGMNIIDGTPVYCVYDNGSYKVLTAGCE